MIKSILIIFFLLINYISQSNAQVNCDTSLLIASFAKVQFGHSGAYDLQEYKCLKNSLKAKKYLLKLLKKEWNKEDYIEYIYKIVNRDSIGLHNEAMRLIKKDSSRYKIVYDSLKNEDVKVFEERRLNERVSGYLIEIAGYLYYKESIPILKKLLNDPKVNTNPYPQYIYKIKLSLARLGDVESENDVIKLTEKDTALKTLSRRFRSNHNYEYFVFLIDNPLTPSLLGKGYGLGISDPSIFRFVLVCPNVHAGASVTYYNTVTHELGHGVFNLYHPFNQFSSQYTQGKDPENFMDYQDGDKSRKYQWDYIHKDDKIKKYKY